MGKDQPFSIFCALRPLPEGETESCCKMVSPATVTLELPGGSRRVHKEVMGLFRCVYLPEDSQKKKFINLCIPIVVGFLQGSNALLFTYGVTGSGKTYTMMGTDADPGFIPRALDAIFNSIGDQLNQPYTIQYDSKSGEFVKLTDAERMLERQRREILPSVHQSKTDTTESTGQRHVRDSSKFYCVGGKEHSRFTVIVSYVEVYNKNVHDLLDDVAWVNPQGEYKKSLRMNSEGDMFVGDCIHVEVRSSDEAFDLLMKGNQRRKQSGTLLNTSSSRGHAVFTINLIRLDDPESNTEQTAVISKLCLVDLAGCERQSRAQTSGNRLEEASHINNSLLALRQCIEVMRLNQNSSTSKAPVPYRDSKLTMLFKYFFEGHGRTFMLLCLNPSIKDYEENLQAMKFAERTQNLEYPIIESESEVKQSSLSNLNEQIDQIVKLLKECPEVAAMETIIEKIKDQRQTNLKILKKLSAIETEWNAMWNKLKSYEDIIAEKEKSEVSLTADNHILRTELANIKERMEELRIDNEMLKRGQQLRTEGNDITYRTEYIMKPFNVESEDLKTKLFYSQTYLNHVAIDLEEAWGLGPRKSTSDTWVNHTPKGTQATESILQPRFTGRRSRSYDSCSNRMVEDLTGSNAVNKYALTHQEISQDDGNLKTSILKGDVHPTPTGGASVVFKEVETVDLDDSLTRKRPQNDDSILGAITNAPKIRRAQF